jgi:hypothetical protein
MTQTDFNTLANVAGGLIHRVQLLGYDCTSIELNFEDSPQSIATREWFMAHHIYIRMVTKEGEGFWTMTPEKREKFAEEWGAFFQDDRISRIEGNLHIQGVQDGLTFSIYLGEGLCEKVQVGTRTVMRPAPDAPLVEVEEPIYEYKCQGYSELEGAQS